MNKRISLLLSGGLDSYVAYYFAAAAGYSILPINIDLGHPYGHKEKEAIKKLGLIDRTLFLDCKVLSNAMGNQPTIDNWTIPARNLLLGTIGAMYSPEVWLCALSTEYNRVTKNADKSYEFFLMASGLLTFVCGMVQEGETLRKETLFRSPFKNLSKREVIYWALNNGISEVQLSKTTSCFDNTIQACGKCPACFNRWVAMKLNGIEEPHTIGEHPYDSPRGQKYLTEMREAIIHTDFTHYTPQRIYEAMRAVSKGGILLDSITNHFVDSHMDEFESRLTGVASAHQRISE
ncbi:MAG: 7-cyano-7-deazaguanine synthase [Bacteroidales bacterium]